MTELSLEQSSALDAIENWLALPPDQEPFFVLSGSAGTGKTFCIRELTDRIKGRFVFTAPTNKATKVLRESVTRPDYKPKCRTIYSLLGLRLEANGEVKELKAPEDPIDLSSLRAVVVDEGSMINNQVMSHIQRAAVDYKVKFLFLGDPAQLPPVKELRSPIWTLPVGARLETVMRHDNQILELATRLRNQVDKFSPSIKLLANHDDTQGIWKLAGVYFTQEMLKQARGGRFSVADGSKVIAWRNLTVDRYNKLIRNAIFDEPTQPWLVGDRVLFAGPAKDLDDEPMASTDDEGTITRVDTEWHALAGDFKIWRIAITLDDNRPVIARVLHEDSQATFAQHTEQLAAAARGNSRLWKKFWEFKDLFHSLRYAYAITAHRSQGSTYDTAFVDWQDILANHNRQEAYRCLYVACTRPKRALILS